MDPPSFDNIFWLIVKLSLTIGLITFKPKHKWNKYDWAICYYGYKNILASFYCLLLFEFIAYENIRNL